MLKNEREVLIKIDKGFSSIKKKKVPLEILAQEHYNRVISKKGKYVSPLKKLEEERERLKKKNRNKDILLIEFLEKVTAESEFKRLIVSPLSEYPKINKDYVIFEKLFSCSDKRQKILDLFGFKRLRGLDLMFQFAKNLGVKTCPYCNSQFILTLAKSKKANLHFDHFYPQKDFPYLSLSYFNLIPCCSNCNVSKSSKSFNTEKNVHPYLQSLHNKFFFKANTKDIINMIISGKNDPEQIKIEILPMPGFKDVIDLHNSNFRIQEIYDNHKDVAMEVVAKAYAYPEIYKERLKATYPLSDSDIKRFLLGTYTLKSEINQRPLTKFIQDLYSGTKTKK